MSAPCPNCGRLNREGARFCASCQTPLVPAAARLKPGQLLAGGAYRVVRPLGKGGMGAVWLVAQTRAFDRLAVLKEVIDYFDPVDPEARRRAAERFEAEARTLGDLKHPGIPDLYAYFSEGSHNYLLMEYIEGQDLQAGLTRVDGDTGQLTPGSARHGEDVLRYTVQICEVLEYLAGRKPPVVHNDVKPANIIVDSHSGRAVLVDFGTAKTRYLSSLGAPDRKKDSVYGTVGYAAPELYRGHSEPRSDVYSLAATAYHLLTDDDPRDHPAQYPALDSAQVPPPLSDILRAALENSIDDRLTATRFRERLEGYLAGQAAPQGAAVVPVIQTLPFPGGTAASTLEELVSLSASNWRYAAGLLADGTLANWLRHSLRDARAAQMAEGALKQWPRDPDAALDHLLRQLQTGALPRGEMELVTRQIRLLDLVPGNKAQAEIQIANRGQGYLRGEALGTQPWIDVRDAFACPPGQVCSLVIGIDIAGFVPEQVYAGAVTLTPEGGIPEVIPIQVASTSPSIVVTQGLVDFGTVPPASRRAPRQSFAVKNVGRVPARCRVLGMPAWLLIQPEAFNLKPGGEQPLELTVRMDKVQSRRNEVVLTIALEQGQSHQVEVRLRTRSSGLFG